MDPRMPPNTSGVHPRLAISMAMPAAGGCSVPVVPIGQYQQSDGEGHYHGVLMTLACTVTRAWKSVLRLPGFLGSTIRLLSASILQSKILNSSAGDLPCLVT